MLRGVALAKNMWLTCGEVKNTVQLLCVSCCPGYSYRSKVFRMVLIFIKTKLLVSPRGPTVKTKNVVFVILGEENTKKNYIWDQNHLFICIK